MYGNLCSLTIGLVESWIALGPNGSPSTFSDLEKHNTSCQEINIWQFSHFILETFAYGNFCEYMILFGDHGL